MTMMVGNVSLITTSIYSSRFTFSSSGTVCFVFRFVSAISCFEINLKYMYVDEFEISLKRVRNISLEPYRC
jgi:hypothetical protein